MYRHLSTLTEELERERELGRAKYRGTSYLKHQNRNSYEHWCCLTWCQRAGHLGLKGSAGLTESLSSHSASDKSSWPPWSTLPPWSYSEHSWSFPALLAHWLTLAYSGLPPGGVRRCTTLMLIQYLAIWIIHPCYWQLTEHILLKRTMSALQSQPSVHAFQNRKWPDKWLCWRGSRRKRPEEPLSKPTL